MRLLVVEDEADLQDLLVRRLKEQAYSADVAFTGAQATAAVEVNEYDLVVLDLGLPDFDGLALLRKMRELRPHVPILVLTARRRSEERVAGLDAGADDYLCKPFFFKEFLARVRVLLRRDSRERIPMLTHKDIQLDSNGRLARKAGEALDLTRKEFAVLEYFMYRPGEVVSHEELLEHVWDDDANPFSNTVRVHVNALRRKLGDNVRHPRYIHTLAGEGYRFGSRDG